MFEDTKFKILTTMKSGMDEKGGRLINFWYNCTIEDVVRDFDKAKEFYEKHVFPNFVAAYCISKAEELGIPIKDIQKAIEDGRIPPMEHYDELMEFTV